MVLIIDVMFANPPLVLCIPRFESCFKSSNGKFVCSSSGTLFHFERKVEPLPVVDDDDDDDVEDIRTFALFRC